MLPKIALILCTVFVLFLLRLDKKQSIGVSSALWIPTIWMLSIASKPLAIWFGARGGGNMEAGSPMDEFFLVALLCMGLIILVMRRFSWHCAIKENTWLMLLITYMLISILWSDSSFISFKRFIREVLVPVVMAAVVASERSPRLSMEHLIRRSVYILIPFSLLLVKYFPEYGVQFARWSGMKMWIGVTLQKNGFGRLCIISAFFLIWSLVRRRQGSDIPVVKYQTYADVFVLMITLWLMRGGDDVGAYSATGVTTLTAVLVMFFSLLWMKKHRIYIGTNTLTVIILLCIIFGLITLFTAGSTVAGFTSTVGRDTTLTGRTDVWLALLPVALQRSIAGHGIGGFWSTENRLIFDISEAHSGYLEIILELGFIGIFLYTMFLLSFCRKAQKLLYFDFYWGCLLICYLLMTIVHNITESSLNDFASQLPATLLFLTITSTASSSYTQVVSREM